MRGRPGGPLTGAGAERLGRPAPRAFHEELEGMLRPGDQRMHILAKQLPVQPVRAKGPADEEGAAVAQQHCHGREAQEVCRVPRGSLS